MKLKVVRSSGNVLKDLGFPEEEAEYLRVRADLLIQIQKAIEARGLKQAEGAKLLGVGQPRVSDLVRGCLDLFSVDSLIDMLAKLGSASDWSTSLPRNASASRNTSAEGDAEPNAGARPVPRPSPRELSPRQHSPAWR